MDLNKELEDIFKDPLFELSSKEKTLFSLPADMREKTLKRKQPDFYGKREKCLDFEKFRPLFARVNKELKEGKRHLIKTSKTTSIVQRHYYIVGGQLVYLDKVGKTVKAANGTDDARTRCIYEDGTESNILLQTLRKNVLDEGYAVTETQDENDAAFFKEEDIESDDKVTGYVYVLKSLSDNPQISSQQDLYKIGFTTKNVEKRIANAVHEPTYLMAPVKIISSYKIVNMDSHKFETLLHKVLSDANFKFTVIDDEGKNHRAREWYVVPFPIIEDVIRKITDGSVVNYKYNRGLRMLEKNI